MAVKDFFGSTWEKYKKSKAERDAVREAERKAYLKARVENADKYAEAKVAEELAQKHKKIRRLESEQDEEPYNFSDAILGPKKKRKNTPSITELKI